MSDAVGVNVVECSDKLLCDFSDLSFFEAVVIFNDIEKLSLPEFSDEYEFRGSLEGV